MKNKLEFSPESSTILIIDDNATNLLFLSKLLSRMGYYVQAVSNPKMAELSLEMKLPDLILLDIMLPDMDGYEFCEKLKSQENTQDIPVVFISALDEPLDKVKAFAVGGADYIVKPFQSQEVIVRIENQLRFKKLQRKLIEQNVHLQQQIKERDYILEELKIFQDKLQKTTFHLASLIQNLLVGILVEDELGNIALINEEFCHLFSFTDNSFIIVGKQYYQLLEQYKYLFTEGENFIARTKVISSQREKVKGEEIYLVDGRTYERDYIPIFDDDKYLGNLWVYHDVSDRKLAEKELKTSEERWQLAIEASKDGICDFNLSTSEVFCSPRFQELILCETKKRKSILSIDEIREYIHPDDRDLVIEAQQAHFEQKTPYLMLDYRIQCSCGEYKWISERGQALWDENGQALRFISTYRDISQRKKQEEELRQTQDFLDSIIQNIPDMIFVKNAENMQFVTINKAGEKLLGYSKQELLGKTDNDLYSPEEAQFLSVQNQTVVTSKKILDIPEHTINSPEQGLRILHTKIVPIFHRSNNAVEDIKYLLNISQDITESKKQQAALQVMIEGTAAQTGSKFFRSLVYYLARVLSVKYSCITKFVDNNIKNRVVTLAFSEGENFIENREYNIENTPCEKVLNGEFVFYPSNLPQLFPDNKLWVEMGVQSYIGIPLYDSTGKIIGALTVLDIKPIIKSKTTEMILRIFAARAGAELERQFFELALQSNNQQQKQILSVVERMRQTLDIDHIVSVTCQELRQILKCDRVAIYSLNSDNQATFVYESTTKKSTSLFIKEYQVMAEKHIENYILTNSYEQDDYNLSNLEKKILFQPKLVLDPLHSSIESIENNQLNQMFAEFFHQLNIQAYTIVPIFSGGRLWGVVGIYQNAKVHQWKKHNINVIINIIQQLGIALHQTELFMQVQEQSVELKKARDNAETASQAKTDFLARMSHELRTPLNAILGFSQVMSQDPCLSEKHQLHLNIINRSGEHLLQLINDILEMSKIETGKLVLNLSNFDLYYLLNNLENLLRLKAIKKQLNLIFEIDENVPQYVTTDEVKLRQILLNLLGNAIKFTEQGYVKLRVKLIADNNERDSIFGLLNILFSIEDTGIGISSEHINKLFCPFEQMQGAKFTEGTGLGLAISQKFVHLMGGQIRVNSVLGLGSIFEFNIKLSIAKPVAIPIPITVKKVLHLADNQPIYRLLVVEDNWESRELLLEILKPLGFEVFIAENGKVAIEMWLNYQPHLILMDMQMPIMNGYEATTYIRSKQVENWTNIKQHTKIIALTASAFERDKKSILSMGCDDFIRKPFTQELLLSKLEEHLEVQYIYEDNNEDIPGKSASSGILTLSTLSLKVMPPEWISELEIAANRCSNRHLLALISQIPEIHHDLSQNLINLVNTFNFEKIVQLCIQTRSH